MQINSLVTTLELPPRLSLSNRVSCELRYGTCARFSSSALITSPSADRLLHEGH